MPDSEAMTENEILWWQAWYNVTLMPIQRDDFYSTRTISAWASGVKMYDFLSEEKDPDYQEYLKKKKIEDLRAERAKNKAKLNGTNS